MKKSITAVLSLLLLIVGLFVTPVFAEVKGKDNPHLISSEIAYRQLFGLLIVDKEKSSAQSVQAYCDYVLKLTQPEKEELLRLVQSFKDSEQIIKGRLVSDDNEKDKSKKLTADQRTQILEYRKNLGRILATQFSAKDKLDAVLERVKRETTLDSESDSF